MLFDLLRARRRKMSVENRDPGAAARQAVVGRTSPESPASAVKHHVLTVTLPSDREIALTRVFDAPRRLVFEACTKPQHLARWWGPHGSTLIVCEMDLRPGGAWRFVLRGPDGQEHPFKGVYREIVPPERVVQTFIYDVEGIRDHEAIETLTLDEQDGRTTLRVVVLHQTKEARDGHIQSGMEAGAGQSYDRLAELLKTMI
jgi:uncharacterized protein YndB with AHSA1/START domain